MDAGERPRLQRFATDPAGAAKTHIQVVDVGSRQISDRSAAEIRVEVAVKYGSGLADCGRCLARFRDRIPPFERLPHRCSRRNTGTTADGIDHDREFAFGLGPVAAHRLRPVAALASLRIDTGEHAEFERADAALADRSLHTSSIGRSTPRVDGLMGK
jgi:hypothetical protein